MKEDCPYDTSSSFDRKIIDLSKYGFQNVMVLGKYNYTNTKQRLALHTHGDMMEICFCSKGEQEYEVNEKIYKIKGGELFVTYPGELHGTGKFPEEKGELYWIIINVNQKTEPRWFLRFQGKLAEEWQQQLLQLPRHFKGDKQLRPKLEKIFSLQLDKKDFFTTILMQHLVADYLIEVINCSKRIPSEKHSVKFELVNDFIKNHVDEPVSLPRLADIAGLSISRFKAWFKEETGTTPLDYALRYKIIQAKELLQRTQLSVTSIAYETGFPNSQYFATVFKKFTGVSPSEYRKNITSQGFTS